MGSNRVTTKPHRGRKKRADGCSDDIYGESPSFGFIAPDRYCYLTEEEKKQTATLCDDFCIIKHPGQTDRFIRVVLEVPILGVREPFRWGAWISLSEIAYEKYLKNFRNETYEDSYFGWFCNRLPYYPDTLELKAQAIVHPGGQRPTLEFWPSDHALATDHKYGISCEKADEIAQIAMHGMRHDMPFKPTGSHKT